MTKRTACVLVIQANKFPDWTDKKTAEKVIRRKPYLRLFSKILRQKNAMEHLQEPDTFWKQVLLNEQVSNYLFVHNQKNKLQEKGAAFLSKNTLAVVQHGGRSIMLWDCVASSGIK